MSYDPSKPAASAPNSSAEMRGQLTALKALIDAVTAVTGATVDSVTIGSGTSVNVSLVTGVLHFDFILQPGPPGEVTQAQLSNDLSNTANQAMLNTLPQTSANSNNVSTLSLTVSDPPTQGEVQAVANKLDELINALRR